MSTAQDTLLREAAEWYARLCDEQASAEDQRAHAAWLARSPEHARLWQKVEQLRATLHRPGGHAALGSDALHRASSQRQSRRRVLRQGSALGLLLGLGGVLGWQVQQQHWLAQYRTATGERREIVLADGTQLWLNSGSAVDVSTTAAGLAITLHQGEILVQTGHEGLAPPTLATAHGQVRPLGTRFVVRTTAPATHVAVLEDAVLVQPAASLTALPLQAGAALWFDAQGPLAQAPQRLPSSPDDWARGLLVVDDWPLAAFLEELGRYRPGVLGCDPAVAGLRLSGAFSVDDIDGTLAALQWSLPVRVQQRTRYWTRVLPAGR